MNLTLDSWWLALRRIVLAVFHYIVLKWAKIR